MIDIIWIAIIWVIILDISGFMDNVKSGLKRLFTMGRMSDPNYSLKPFDCSFCMTFWTGLVYLFITHSFSLWMLAYLLCICVMTPVISLVLVTIRDIFIKIIRKI